MYIGFVPELISVYKLKKKYFGYALISLMFASMVSSVYSQAHELTGKDVYSKKCSRCHGLDGTKGMFKAKNLHISVLG